MNPIIVFALAGLATYVLRSSLVMGGRVVRHGGWLEQRIAFVGPSVLAALVASSLFLTDGDPTFGRPAEILAVAAGFGVVARTDNVGLALVVGLPVYWAATALGLG